jgi:hypothetical protein
VRVEGLRDDAPARGRERREPAQEPAGAGRRSHHPEVPAEQHDRVEPPERVGDVLQRDPTDVAHAALRAARDRAGGRVDADDRESAPLHVQAGAAAAAADVEHAAADEPHRPLLGGIVPPREGCHEVARVAGAEEAVVALGDLHRAPPGEHVREQRAIHVRGGDHRSIVPSRAERARAT